ncbi:AraC family transcriptional regulator [Archangium lansingense]|uniref:AraC family transcriptional regulator n=1 Tax=Archangium lansingense TaxID=2995310 RepID=A0ABT4A2L9_9BACT|nr:AraC family transcriptional regulator [Archangium lansinium]MCY1075880.1 AraC family transcriptional regulator [Archangium lansinium]
MKTAVEQYIDASGGGEGVFSTPIEGLVLMRTYREVLPHHLIYKPALCIAVQGSKQVSMGSRVFDYTEMQALVVGVELPAFGRVTRASATEPYLGMTVEFDVGVMREVMEQLEAPSLSKGDSGSAVFVEELTAPLVDCLSRLVRMLATPKAIPVLHPSVMREICFWLLTGPHGDEFRKLALPNGHMQRIADAIYILRKNFSRPIRIKELAAAARMSESSFHQHFRGLMSMTPLQYQKQLRLLEARRLMVADGSNVMEAALQVGYESASQFSREYSRMFGTPPKRDAMRALRTGG